MPIRHLSPEAFENITTKSLADVKAGLGYVGLKKRFLRQANTQTPAGPLMGSDRFVSALFCGRAFRPGLFVPRREN